MMQNTFSPVSGNLSISSRCRRGLSFVEVMIAMSVMGLSSLALTGVMRTSALTIKDIYAITRGRSIRMIAIDQVRYRLAEASRGSVTILDAGNTIRFVDPNLVTTSEFSFDAAAETLSYDDDINDGTEPIIVSTGPIELTFEAVNLGNEEEAAVLLSVRSGEDIAFGDIDSQDGDTRIYLRNS